MQILEFSASWSPKEQERAHKTALKTLILSPQHLRDHSFSTGCGSRRLTFAQNPVCMRTRLLKTPKNVRPVPPQASGNRKTAHLFLVRGFPTELRGVTRAKLLMEPTPRRTPQDERTPAARSAQRGFFHARGRAGKEGRPWAEHTRQLTRRCKPSCAYPRQHQTEYQSGSREVSS